MKRREFIKLLGVASGATLVTSCRLKEGTDKLIPHLIPPEDGLIPGEGLYYSTTCTECPANCGVQAKVHEKLDGTEYRRYPTKLEGAPAHPINDGALCIRGQASLTRLYHPDRLGEPLIRSADGSFKKASWEEALGLISKSIEDCKREGLKSYFLSGRTTGHLSQLIGEFCKARGVERLPEFELFSYSAIREASRTLFGRKQVPHYRIDQADLLLTVGADILETHINPVSNALQLSRARGRDGFTWFHVEPHLSMTGLKATSRAAVNPGSEPYLLLYLLRSVSQSSSSRARLPEGLRRAMPDIPLEEVSRQTGIDTVEIEAMAKAFSVASKPLVIAGGVSTSHSLGLDVAFLSGLINHVTGATSSLVDFSRRENYDSVGSMLDVERFSEGLRGGRAGVLFLSQTKKLIEHSSLKDSVGGVKLKVAFSEMMDEACKLADVVLPLSHSLEAWGDAEPRKGLRTLIQPVLLPLHDTLAAGDILMRLLDGGGSSGERKSYQEYVLSGLKKKYGESRLEELLSKGYLVEDVAQEKVALDDKSATAFLKDMKMQGPIEKPVLVVAPSLRTYDGRSRDLPLLEEIPDPLSTISYGKWVSAAKDGAAAKGLRDGDELELSREGATIRLPARLFEKVPQGVYVIQQEAAEGLQNMVDSRTGELLAYYPALNVKKTGSRAPLPILTGSLLGSDREIISTPEHEEHDHGAKKSIYPKHEHKDYRWAMAIDLDRCSGCSACVAACYIENNVPVVGVQEHLRGREMSWIRIERHVDDSGETKFVPMLCQHCDNAPCEPVCPVYAAYHNDEGLNAQIYNRCVGTRYCSNNCPYKVRRFNWFDHPWPAPMDKMLNPDLSVRTKGIMEKCTFCIQRITKAKDVAKDESRKVLDGDVTPACAQTCPSKAIVFGNILDEESRVHAMAHSERAQRILETLGTEPAIHYLTGKKGQHAG